MNTTLAPEYYSAAEIARALSTPEQPVNKKYVQRLAMREAWPLRQTGNRFEYQVPPAIAEIMIGTPESATAPAPIIVRFADLVADDAQREIVLLREQAVQLLGQNLCHGKEAALQLVCSHMAALHPLFRCSISSLRRWAELYAAHGLDGLVEQKRGRVGRKAFARDLEAETVLKYRARAIGYGGRQKNGKSVLNVARAYRELVADGTVAGAPRQWLHGAHASKSYVPPSVRAAMQTPELATKLIQIGPRAAKLDGPYTECSYGPDAIRAITADDMTANCYVWVPWPNEQGFLLIRPQILALMNVGTMAWLNLRAIIRPKGQYNRDDVWGLLGDYLDDYGLSVDAQGVVNQIAVLEGGTWQSGVVVGSKVPGVTEESRFGGLRALGVKVIHTRTPRGKIIETAFNTLQHAADNVRGFCGRMEMKDCPEDVKQQLALVKAGHAHPRQFFLSLEEYSDHLTGVMQALNNERNDGKILRGRSPAEAWAEINPQFREFPDASKWLYRAAYRLVEVTRNGVRILVGSGKFQTAYTYTHPALEPHRGRRVAVYWNDANPDTDAVIYTIQAGKPHTLICCASRLKTPDRFGATDEELKAEAQRKKLAQQLAVSHSRTLAPYLPRRVSPSPGGAGRGEGVRNDIGAQIAAAREAAQEKEAAQARTRRNVHAAVREITPQDTEAALALNPERETRTAEQFSNEEIADIFKTD